MCAEPKTVDAQASRSGSDTGKKLRTTSALLLACAALVWSGSRRAPADATQPVVLRGRVDAAASHRFRVATFNIHGGCGLDGQLDLERTARCLQGVDVIGLTEVHGFCGGAGRNQAAQLGRILDMAWLFVPTERRWWHNHFGNGLLTRRPLTSQQVVPLPATQHKYRNALLTGFDHSGRTIHLLATHIDPGRDRETQLRAVITLFLSLAEPAILMGDLNTNADDPQLSRLLSTPGVDDAVASGLKNPLPAIRIDWIITRGLRCSASQYQQTPASDHPVVWAELEVSGSPQG